MVSLSNRHVHTFRCRRRSGKRAPLAGHVQRFRGSAGRRGTVSQRAAELTHEALHYAGWQARNEVHQR